MEHGKIPMVELYIQCQNLPKMDILSESDPFVVVYMMDQNKRIKLGKTEIIDNDPNPKFNTRIKVPYHFEQIQELVFEVYDSDSESLNLEDHDFIGSCKTTLGEIIASKSGVMQCTLLNKLYQPVKKNAFLWVHAQKVKRQTIDVQFQFRALLENSRFFVRGLLFRIYKKVDNESFVSVYESELVPNSKKPLWLQATINLDTLCNSNLSTELRIDVLERTWRVTTELIGSATCSALTLLGTRKCRHQNLDIPQMGPMDESKNGEESLDSLPLICVRKRPGILILDSIVLINRAEFLEYIQAGMQINLCCAVDFTLSNGEPNKKNSLHYIPPEPKMIQNDYYRAMERVSKVLAPYDNDGKIPFFGFGATLLHKDGEVVSNCFPINMRDNDPDVQGVFGLLEAYRNVFHHIAFSGPTHFSEVIHTVAKRAQMAPFNSNKQIYHILLLLTDGIINDMKQTIDEIVEASELPLSIIIVGVGDADFSNMNILDADDVPLKHSNGNIMKRDIVQFVPMRDFELKLLDRHQLTGTELEDKIAQVSKLAEVILEEIPNQITSFTQLKGVPPLQVQKYVQASVLSSSSSSFPIMPTAPNFYDDSLEVDPGSKEGVVL